LSIPEATDAPNNNSTIAAIRPSNGCVAIIRNPVNETQSTINIGSGTSEISRSASNRRTEQQVASLDEMAAEVNEIT
jgi:hypothetical protein